MTVADGGPRWPSEQARQNFRARMRQLHERPWTAQDEARRIELMNRLRLRTVLAARRR